MDKQVSLVLLMTSRISRVMWLILLILSWALAGTARLTGLRSLRSLVCQLGGPRLLSWQMQGPKRAEVSKNPISLATFYRPKQVQG